MTKIDKRAKKDEIYGNHEMYSPPVEGHPYGVLMFRTKLKRVKWFIDRNLASVIEEKNGIIKARFNKMPNGLGRHGDPYLDQVMENRCVISGVTENLNRHHIVPKLYRNFYPRFYKKMCHHDIVAIDVNLHSNYENTSATELKKYLGEKYDAPFQASEIGESYSISTLTYAYQQYGHLMPEEKINLIFSRMKNFLNKNVITQTDITLANHGKIVLDAFDDMQGFVEMWREHFLEHTNPKFMPDNWDVKRPIDTIHKLQEKSRKLCLKK